MKKILSLLAMLIAFQFSYAQWTTSGSNTTTTDNVGIGTTSPEAGFRFDANGLGAIGTQSSARIYLGTTDATHAFIQSRDNSINQNLSFSASSYNFGVGNVGIGTTSPQFKLDVQEGNAGIYNTGSTSQLLIGSAATGKTYLAFNTSADAAGYTTITSISSSGSTYGNLAINPDGGNVAIGAVDPQGYKLAVNGTIHTKEVKVDLTGWSDYVFKPEYKLLSLSEVKSYIDKNQHLPDVPSEQDVITDGVNLGEMNKVLVKKVEELTLYLIEKDKQLNDQTKQIQNQEERLKALEKAIGKLSQ